MRRIPLARSGRRLALVALVALVGCGVDGAATAPSDGGAALAALTGFSEWSAPQNLGAPINTTYNDQQPALSKDGLALYFASNRPEHEGDASLDNNIWVASRACGECPWQAPRLLGPPVNSTANENSPNLSRDGHALYFASTRAPGPGTNDIWVARRAHVHEELEWSTAERLGPGVNTPLGENGASLLEIDGRAPQLYFGRQSGATVATGDIYVSELGADGEWGTATPVSELNSALADLRPSLRHDGRTIYFWSGRDVGSGTIGGGFLWYATRASPDDAWSAPAPVESPIVDRSSIQPFIFTHGQTETIYFVHNMAASGMDLDIVMSTRTRGGPRE